MTIAVAVILICLGAQLAVLAANIIYWLRRRLPLSGTETTISVLVPARNERENLPRLARALAGQVTPPMEALVCDDGSDDGTQEWLIAHGGEHGLQWFEGEARPDGWTGKNWACHQLASRAQGEWLLFLDADAEPSPGFVDAMAGLLAETDAGLVTGIPRWVASGVGDGLLVAMVPFSVLTILPLPLAERWPNPAFAFANGQVMAFRRSDYEAQKPHEHVRGEVLEDVRLAELTKARGQAVLVANLCHVLRVRMYSGTGAAVDGFAKNAVQICRGVRRTMAYATVMALLYLAPIGFLAAGEAWAAPAAALAALLYGVCAAIVGLPWWYGALYPAAVLLAEAVFIRSIAWHRRGDIQWRGRVYKVR